MVKNEWVFECDRCGRIEAEHYIGQRAPYGWTVVDEPQRLWRWVRVGYSGKHLCGSCSDEWYRLGRFMTWHKDDADGGDGADSKEV